MIQLDDSNSTFVCNKSSTCESVFTVIRVLIEVGRQIMSISPTGENISQTILKLPIRTFHRLWLPHFIRMAKL